MATAQIGEKRTNMKKTLLIIILSIGIVGLGVVAYLTATQLSKIGTTPIAPTAGEEAAAGQNPCVTTFTVTEAPQPSPPVSPSPSPSVSPSPSPAPVGCGNACTVDNDCTGTLVCEGNKCVNPVCTAETDCVCPVASPSPSPSPSPELSSCGDSCNVDIDCAGSLICVNDKCVNPQCTSDSDCICSVGGPARTPTPTPETVEEVELPEAGISLPTLGLLAAGLTTLLLGALVLAW